MPVLFEISEGRMGQFRSALFRVVPCEIFRRCIESLPQKVGERSWADEVSVRLDGV